jgi:hypothetical protein
LAEKSPETSKWAGNSRISSDAGSSRAKPGALFAADSLACAAEVEIHANFGRAPTASDFPMRAAPGRPWWLAGPDRPRWSALAARRAIGVIPGDKEGFLQIGRAKGHGHLLRLAIFPIYPEYCLMRKFSQARRAACSSILLCPVDFPTCFPASSATDSRFSQFPFCLNLPPSRRGISHDLRSRLR